MKTRVPFCLLFLIGIFVTLTPAYADIVAKEFVIPGTGKIESGFVLQGSRDMKRLGKSGKTSTIVVPPFTPLSPSPVPTVIPALKAPEITPKPRFGYGSDYVPGAEDFQSSVSQAASVPLFTPIYQQPQKTSYWSFQSPWYFYPGSAYLYQPSFGYPCHPSLSYRGSFFSGGALSFSWGGPFLGWP